MPISITVVDAFTSQPFAGNPAGVCFPDAGKDASWMQAVAAEMNLAETAFLQPRPDGFGLRWFTPTVEMDLCGHATLASAHVLWETGKLPKDAAAHFHTRSGELICRRGAGGIEMDFPSISVEPAQAPAAMLDALALNRSVVRWAGTHKLGHMLELDSAATVRGLRPDFAALAKASGAVVSVTAAVSEGKRDFVSRLFAPNIGIDEDPVTGGAHCWLGPYWCAKLGKAEVLGHQVSARGGYVRVRPRGDRVILGGSATTVLRGELA
jgi:PhzF family phenazine biosynthesis protein